MNGQNRDMDELFRDDERILKALREAYYDAVRLHRAYGVPMVFWENGKVVEIPPEQLVADIPPDYKSSGVRLT